MSKLVGGMGFNDRKYPVKVGKRDLPEYTTWRSMIERCREKYWKKHPTYIGTTCSENFKSYTFFYEWCQEQKGFCNKEENGRSFALDKDILIKGNKTYSEDTCVFVPQRINNLLTKRKTDRGNHPIGTYWHKSTRKYVCACSSGKDISRHLGLFNTPEEAFQVYKAFKEALVKQVANEYKEQIDQRAYNALMSYEVNIND